MGKGPGKMTTAFVILLLAIPGGFGLRCFHCVWFPTTDLPSAKNASEVCRPHGFRLPMLVEECALGCVVSILYQEEKPNITYRNSAYSYLYYGKGPTNYRRGLNETSTFNVTLPPMSFFLRGCARVNLTGCIMDFSRPGVFHEDCFCHGDLCNGKLLNGGIKQQMQQWIWISLLVILLLAK